MATAIYRGINLPDNCLVHAKSLLMSKKNPISGQDEKISKLSSDVEKISRSLNEIIEANDSNGNRKNDVHDLLTNVIEFCNSTETMDKESLTSLVEILEKTDDAFNELDKNIKNTKIDEHF